MRFKLFFLSFIAVAGVTTPVFAKSKTVSSTCRFDSSKNNTENNVSPDTEQVAEHDMTLSSVEQHFLENLDVLENIEEGSNIP